MTWTPIVDKKFSKEEFENYVKSLNLAKADWKPSFIVLHNTSEPTLAEYKQFAHRKVPVSDTQWMNNLAGYYRRLGWSAGPHLFIVPTGILAFTPLTHHGVHSPSWNSVSWGIEMTGDYDKEPFDP